MLLMHRDMDSVPSKFWTVCDMHTQSKFYGKFSLSLADGSIFPYFFMCVTYCNWFCASDSKDTC